MKSKFFLFLMAVLFVVVVSGCSMSSAPSFDKYYLTTLNVSTSAEVIPAIQAGGDELTKGENAVASWGEKKKGSIVWFNAIAFDDDTSKAIRKYGFSATPKNRSERMRFDAELVINADVLSEPYANENARKIAVLKSILNDFTNDLAPLVKDSRALNSGSLMVKRLLKNLIARLDASPALAGNLGNYSGMDFNSMNLGKGKARMTIVDGVVSLKSVTGSSAKNFGRKLEMVSE